MASTRKVVCISYETGKSGTRNGRSYPYSTLANVWSAFVDAKKGITHRDRPKASERAESDAGDTSSC
jgi:hypothetical protein